MRMNMSDFATFFAVARNQSFRAAGDELQAYPALSVRVAIVLKHWNNVLKFAYSIGQPEAYR